MADMKDSECVKLLQWALPRLRMRWSGFRKIRGRVCKRIARRVNALQLGSVMAYRDYLEKHPGEWRKLDELCRVTISRFYRDKLAFAFLGQEVLPALAEQALTRGEEALDVWSAGCASGEEPYTLALIGKFHLKSGFPHLTMNVLATDIDRRLLERAERACYTFSSVKYLPPVWRKTAFSRVSDKYCLDADYRRGVTFQCHDIRNAVPEGPFHLILCRNLAFTYFEPELQTAIGAQLLNELKPGGALMIGTHEVLPEEFPGLEVWSQRLGVYRKSGQVAG